MLSFEQMLEESLKTIHTGEVVTGTVIDVKSDHIILDIGYKLDGIITRSEYTNNSNLDLADVVQKGTEISAKVLKVSDRDGIVTLSYKRMAQEKGYKILEEAFEKQEVLKGKVIEILNGGLGLELEGVRIFIPASLVSDSFEKDLNKYLSEELEFVLSEFNPKRRRIIGNRKKLVVEKKEARYKELFETVKVGDVVEGVVKNVTDFGVFVDLNGVDGLLHISEVSWGRIENPKKTFKIGDVIKPFIKEIQDKKIALSLKFEDANPWKDAEVKYAKGNLVKGKVARMTDFGAFIEIENGVDALLHVSQISIEHIEKPSDVLKLQQEIEAKIVDLNIEERKISLSLKALLDTEEKEVVETTEEV